MRRLTDDCLYGGLTPSRAERFLGEQARAKVRPARYGPGEQVLGEWPLVSGDVLRLTTCWYKRRQFYDLRRWYPDAGGVLNPAPRGVRFPAELAGPLAKILGEVA